jgi:hypothetical protein
MADEQSVSDDAGNFKSRDSILSACMEGKGLTAPGENGYIDPDEFPPEVMLDEGAADDMIDETTLSQ